MKAMISFSSLPTPKPDPLFAIAAEAQAAGPEAINGTLGIYMDEEGKPLLFPSVRKAIEEIERDLRGFNYSYPVLTGLPAYRTQVTKLLGMPEDRTASIASTGGTGALAINLRLLKMLLGEGNTDIVVSTPAWANHLPVCRWADLTINDVPYIVNGKASIEGLVDGAKKQKKPFGILLQVGCHNPTGLDLTVEQWEELVSVLQQLPCIALLDFAYQGFKNEPEEDAAVIRSFVKAGITTLVTWSASKNHSVYGLRTGLAAAFVKDEAEKKTVEGTYCTIVRGLHSASPTFGQAIVALTQEKYRSEWLQDLRSARDTMKRKRDLMLTHLPANFHDSLRGYGMFAMLPLSPAQVDRLKHEQKVYLPTDGRVNIAGIPEKRIEELCGKIGRVG